MADTIWFGLQVPADMVTGRLMDKILRALLTIALLIGGLPRAAWARPTQQILSLEQVQEPTWDFETGNLAGWRQTGSAFQAQPTLGDNPTARARGQPSNHQGRYWVGTYERFAGQPGQQPGAVQGDEPQGTLTSIAFSIPATTLSFLVGGGSGFETRVELRVLDPIEGAIRVLSASGQDSETMRRETWDLTPWEGRQGQIRIVDESSGGWGHINADDFVFGPVLPLEVSLEPGAVEIVPGEKILLGARVSGGPESGNAWTCVSNAPDIVSAARSGPGCQITGLSPGTVAVTAVASDGSQRAEATARVTVLTIVPQLTGLSRIDALRSLESAQLEGGLVTSRESEAPEGTVIAQGIEEGTPVPAGTSVEFVLAEPLMTVVPALAGLTEEDALRVLDELRLEIGNIEREESSSPPGRVVDQAPSSGVPVPVGTPVSVAVAVPVTTLVPSLVGLDEEEARAALAESELVVGELQYQESSLSPGTIIDQGLTAETRVDVGTTVPLTVAVTETVPVPNLIGLSADEARRQLLDGRLQMGDEIPQESRDVEVGMVLDQGISAGAPVAVGTPVSIVVATVLLVTVPDVRGLSESDAQSQLAQVGLVVAAVSSRISLSRGGTVLTQLPEAGGLPVAVGTPVDLQVATARVLWAGPAGLLLIGLAGIAGVRSARGSRRRERRERSPRFPPELSVRPESDLGHQTIESKRGGILPFEMRLRPRVDHGEQHLTYEDGPPFLRETNDERS